MNYIKILGERFEDIESTLTHNGIEEVYDSLEGGDEQEYFVSAKNDSWQISLGQNHRIETIFLYMQKGFQEILGINSNSKKKDIENLFGHPKRSGEQSEMALVGKKGEWVRYDFETYALHIEYEIDSNNIKMVTLMLSEVAP